MSNLTKTCPVCKGMGTVWCPKCNGDNYKKECSVCHGDGVIRCDNCNGVGKVEED